MHYKIDNNSQLHKDVTDYFDRKRASRRAIFEFLKAEFGCDSMALSPDGKVVAIGDKPTSNPHLWKPANNGFMPKLNSKAGKAIADKLSQLPAVPKIELIRLLKYPLNDFEVMCGATIGYALLPDGTILISTLEDVPYTPVEGLIEILASEYKALVDEFRKPAITE